MAMSIGEMALTVARFYAGTLPPERYETESEKFRKALLEWVERGGMDALDELCAAWRGRVPSRR